MTSPSDFVHLHVHSDYSLLDGAAKVSALAKNAKKNGQIAIALTDHGTVSGAVKFVDACEKEGVKPLVGCEAYLAPGDDEDAHKRRQETDEHKKEGTGRDYNHFTLIAKNEQGWKNLTKLASIASLEGFYYRPRMSWHLIQKYHEGLIALSGCLKGQTSTWINRGQQEKAEFYAKRWKEVFGKDYYMEIMPSSVDGQASANDGNLIIARKLDIKPIATADLHYIEREDAEAQEVKICVNSHKTLSDNDRLRMSPEFYFRSSENMQKAFSHVPEAILATREVADKVGKIGIKPGKFFLPKFQTPIGLSTPAYFKKLCREGLVRRYGKPTEEQTKRLEYEMGAIEKMGFVDYFLITQDFCDWARKNGVPVGPGRGSAAGAIVAYCLGITNIDPLRYDLIFERFLNPDRVSMPDIDIDFCEIGRGKVIDYVTKKYGEKNVCQIVTWGEFKAKSAIRDVARVIDAPPQVADRLAKLIPNGPKVDLEGSIEVIPELKLAAESEETKRLLSLSLGIEGLFRHAGRHAAGVVIADTDLSDRIPLMMVGKDKEKVVCTQFAMDEVEAVGLLKMDFLGLSTLTVISDALGLIHKTTGIKFSEDDIPVRDNHSMTTTVGVHRCPIHKMTFAECRCCDKTLDLLRRAEVGGVFQVESSGMRKLLIDMKPDRFDDLIAILALYRPGPLGSGMDQTYVNRKNGLEEIVYDHPSLEPVLKDTYGQFIYQEQLMKLSVALAGFTLPESDTLRKATGKKKQDVMDKLKDKFVTGCQKTAGLDIVKATEIWAAIVKFADYSFNKSHSASYALISWHTAWLKANYPFEFMAATLSSWCGDTDKLSEYVSDLRRMGIPLEPPDVNLSQARFSVATDSRGGRYVLYGLEAVKGIGMEVVAHILATRDRVGKFRSISHFCEEVDGSHVTKGVIEILAKAGAFRSTGAFRSQLMKITERTVSNGKKSTVVRETSIETAVRMSKAARKDREEGQGGLFRPTEVDELQFTQNLLPAVPEWGLHGILEAEKESIGFYLTGHPLDEYRDIIQEYVTIQSSRSVELMKAGVTSVVIGGVIRSARATQDKNGNDMAFLAIEDFSGVIDGVCFARSWAENKDLATPGRVVFVTGDLDASRDRPSIRVNKLVPLDQASEFLTGSTGIKILYYRKLSEADTAKIDALILANPGKYPIFQQWAEGDGRSPEKRHLNKVSGSAMLRTELAAVLGRNGTIKTVKY